MLIYDNEGSLEVDSKNIVQLCRTMSSVSIGNAEPEPYEVHAALCHYRDNSVPRCRVAFSCKTLKRSLVFAVKESDNQSSWESGREALVQLGFQLEDVDLKISPAMLEVVLRDIPGLLAPAAARKERAEKERLFADLQESYDKDPDSSQGKQAALKLNAEKRLRHRAEELRLFLEGMFSSHEAVRGDLEGFARQIQELTSRLAAAETLTEAERRQREMSESITAAAEKRIQELEGLLVDFETMASGALKQKRKSTQLQGRIKKLDEALAAAEAAAEKEREKQGQLIAEAHVAHERMTLLQDQLTEAETSLEIIHAQLAKARSEEAQWKTSLEESELRCTTLGTQLRNAEKNAALDDEAASAAAGVRAELDAAQQALEKSLDLNSSLQEKLAAVLEQHEIFAREFQDLRDEYDQECSKRKHLEKNLMEDRQRLREREDALAKMTGDAAGLSEGETDFAMATRAIESLKFELQEQKQQLTEEQQSREELEAEVVAAHKIIDSLENVVRASGGANTVQVAGEASPGSEYPKVRELESMLKNLQAELEQERIEQVRLVKAVAVAEKKITEQEELLVRGQDVPIAGESSGAPVARIVAQAQTKPAKPLPHELRAEPKKGALFCPDWDLQGLPCQSSEQVVKVWETAFNVQISLEGYPSQYCMAFLVVLHVEQQKKLYLLYRLKQSKHTLVCVPAQAPKDEHALKNAIAEGLSFLKMSGFAMETMAAEHVDSTLGVYFLPS